MNVGDTLFYFRESLDINKTAFISSIMTPSYYGRIEKNESDISFTKLLSILKKHNLTPYEFYYRLNDGKDEPFIIWYKKIKRAYYHEDIKDLQKIMEIIPRNDHFYFMGECLLYSLTGKEKINKSALVFYLSSVNRWTEYHILLFLLGTKIFSVKDLIFLFGTFSKNMESSIIYSIYERDIILSLLNIVEACLKQKHVNEANYFLQLVPQIMTDPFYLFERTMVNFYSCFINIVNDINKNNNISECYEIIQLFKKYNMTAVVNLLTNLLILYDC